MRLSQTTPRWAGGLMIMLALGFLAGCDPSGPDDQLPERFRIRGEAAGAAGALDITCTLDLIYERNGESGRVPGGRVIGLEGGGDAARTVLDDTGAGISLQPFLHSFSDEAHLLENGRIEILSPINLDTDIPFYVLIGRLAGRFTGGGRAEGEWECGPFEVRGDTVGIVRGTWQLEPSS